MINVIEMFWSALVAGIVMAVICGFIGTFVVVRRMSFLADTFAHGSLVGIAIGYAFGVGMQATTIPFSIALALVTTWFARNRNESLISMTAVIFSVSVGLGIVMMSYFGLPGQELVHILFGDLLWIARSDLVLLAVLGLPLFAGFLIFRKRLALVYLSEELAVSSGISTGLYDYGSMIGFALTIAICIKLVGVMLVTALLTIPPLIAGRFARNFAQQLWLSPLVAVACTAVGMLISLRLDLPSGGCIATLCGVVFLASGLIKKPC